MSEEKNGWVYILKEREFVKTNENVVKIGRTANKKTRMKKYPKGSEVLECIEVDNTILTENNLKHVFQEKFTIRNDIGKEYFEGDIHEMLQVFKETAIIQTNINTDNTGKYKQRMVQCKCGYKCRSDCMKHHEKICTAKSIIEELEIKVNDMQKWENQILKLNIKLQMEINDLKRKLIKRKKMRIVKIVL